MSVKLYTSKKNPWYGGLIFRIIIGAGGIDARGDLQEETSFPPAALCSPLLITMVRCPEGGHEILRYSFFQLLSQEPFRHLCRPLLDPQVFPLPVG